MKSILYSLLVVLTIAIAGAAILSLIGVAKEVATTLASGSLALFPTLREGFEKWTKDPAVRSALVTFDGYGRSTPLQILYATMVLLAIMNLTGAATGLVIGFGGGKLSPESFGIFSLLVVLPVCFLIGRWMGRTARRDAWWAPLIVAMGARAVTSSFDYLTLNSEEYLSFYGSDKAVAHTLEMGSWGVVVLGAFLYLGYWRGRTLRLANYLYYLLKRVSPEARVAIVDLSYEEAIRSQQGSTASSVGNQLTHTGARR